jgi:hypothetical protein
MMTDEMVDELALAFGWHHVDADGMEYHFTLSGLRDLLSMTRIPPKDVLEAMTASRKALKAAHNLSRSNAPQPEAEKPDCHQAESGLYCPSPCAVCDDIKRFIGIEDAALRSAREIMRVVNGSWIPGGAPQIEDRIRRIVKDAIQRFEPVQPEAAQPAPMPVAVQALLDEIASFQELNQFNYGHDDVAELNNWGVMVWDRAEDLRKALAALPLPAQQVAEQKDAERLLIDVCHIEGSDPFIYRINGKITIGALQELEDAIITYQKEDDDSPPCKATGDYTFMAYYEKPQRGDYGRIEFEGYWDLTLISFKPYSVAIDDAMAAGGQEK